MINHDWLSNRKSHFCVLLNYDSSIGLLDRDCMYYRISLLRCTDPGKCQSSLSFALLALTFLKKQSMTKAQMKTKTNAVSCFHAEHIK